MADTIEHTGDWNSSSPDPSDYIPSYAPTPTTPSPPTIETTGGGEGVRDDPNKWAGGAGLPSMPIPWADVGHQVMSGIHQGAATGATYIASRALNPSEADDWQQTAENQRKAAAESVAAETYSGRAAREGSFFAHPIMQTAEQAPSLAALAVPAAIGTAIGGPLGGIVGGTAGFAEYQRGQGPNDYAAGIMATSADTLRHNIDFANLADQMPEDQAKRIFITQQLQKNNLAGQSEIAGGVTGLLSELGGIGVAKITTSKIANLALGVATPSATLGGLGAEQTYLTQSSLAASGARGPVTPGEVAAGGLEGAESGTFFGVLGAGRHYDPTARPAEDTHPANEPAKQPNLEGSDRDGTQTGGEAHIERKSQQRRAQEANKRDTGASPEAEKGTGPAPPSSPVGSSEEAALKPKPTPRVGEQPEVAQTASVQPTGESTAGPQGGPPAGEAPVGPPPPPPPPPSQPAAQPAPPAPVDPAVLAQQHAELLDASHPRDAMIYPKGVEVPDITKFPESWRYGKVPMPKADGRTVVYDHSPRGSGWRREAIKAAAKDGTLEGKIEARAAEPPKPEFVAEAQPAAAAEGVKEAPAAAAEAAPGRVDLDAIKAQIAARRAEMDAAERGEQPQAVQEPYVEPRVAEEAPTPESKAPTEEKLGENKFGVSIWRKADGSYLKRYADGRPDVPTTEETAQLLLKAESYKPAKSESETIREAAQTEAEKLKLAREKVATLSTKDEETGEETAKPLPEAGARVLHAEDAEEKLRQEAQAKADIERGTAKPAVPPKRVAQPKELQKAGKKSPEDVARMKEQNATANDVVDRHQPKDEDARNREANAVQPGRGAGAAARAVVLMRAKAMLEDAAKNKYEFKGRAMHRIDPDVRHSNKALILYEAKLLVGKAGKVKIEDYARFLRNEDNLLHNGERAYTDVLGERSETGKERAAELGAAVTERATGTGEEEAKATESADEAHERELASALEAKRTKGEELKEKERQEKVEREKEAERQEGLRLEAERVKRSLPAEGEIISPARAKVMDEEGRAGAKETSPGVWRATLDGKVLGDSRGYKTRSEAMNEAEHIVKQDRIAKETREETKLTPESKEETNERQDYERQKKFYEDVLQREGLTEKQKQQARSELAKLKLDWEAREREQTRTNKLKEGEGYTTYAPQTKKVEVVGFKSRAVKKPEGWTKQQLRPGEEYGGKAFADEKERPGTDVTLGSGENKETVRSLKVETAKDAIAKSYAIGRYAAGAPQMMGKLRDLIVKHVGDVVVHYISNADMDRLMGNKPDDDYHTLGGYNSIALNGKPVIVINADYFRGDTAIHEAFHALTDIMLAKHPDLRAAMERLRIEVLQNLPDLTKEERGGIEYFLSSGKEFLTGMMTNWRMQELLKGVKISDKLAKDLGIPKWRKMTMWEGALAIIRDAIGLGARDTSAIEAAMSLTEQLTWRDPKAVGDLMEAAGRMAEKDMKPRWERNVAPAERDQDAAVRSHRETFARVKDIDTQVMKAYGKDTIHNLGGNIIKGTAKLLSGTWLNDVHGHLFLDAKGKILEAINDAQNRVSHLYSTLMSKDKDLINRGYMLDKTHASYMAGYARLVDMSVRYNIHADRVGAQPPKNLWDAARNAWQQIKYGDEARAIYRNLPEELQKRYRDEKKFYVDKQGDAGKIMVERLLPMFDAPKGRTSEEVLDLARKNELEDSDWTHYQKLGVADVLHEAYRLQAKKDVYFNSQRGDGRFVVGGREAMPKGGKDVGYDGSELRDDTREFDSEQQAHAFATSTRMKSTTREINYHKDNASGEIVRVSGEEASSVGDITPKYQVRLERQHYHVADSRAEARRIRQAIEADGIGELTGVMDRRDERAWSELNTADQKLLEKKIDGNTNWSDFEKQQMKDISRQMMLGSRGGMGAHMIQARKVAGARFDSAAGLHAYAKAANFHIARNTHAPALDDAMDRLDKHERANRASDPDNALRRSTVANEYRDRVYGRNASPLGSKSSPFMHRMMTWAFVNFLARPSHILLSQLHPYIYSVPMLAARHGYWKSLQGQRQAMKDLGGMGNNLWEGAKAGYQVYKSGSEQNIDKAVAMARGVDPILRMINGLKDRGERDALMKMWETEHLHSAFDASVFEGSGQDRMNAVIRQFTDAMEANNRLSTALNAYRLEKSMHKDPGNALAYSRRVIEQTHGVFSPTNAASVFKNPIVRPIMQFRQQPMNLAIMMYRNMGKALPEKLGGAGDNEARWTLAYQLGTAAALGGMGGMPMDLPKLVGLAGQAAGGPAPSDWDDKFYRTLESNLGPTAAKAIHDGIPGMMGPYGPSLGHRTGFDAGFLFGEPKSDSADDMFNYVAKDLAGASVGMGMDWLNALHQGEQGNWERTGEYLMPGSLKDFLKTYRNATEGQMAGKEQVSPPSFGKELLQSLGFSDIETERLLTGHYALQKAVKIQETVQDQLKAKHASREKSVLGVKVPKKERSLGEEYENAYQ